MPLVWAHGEFIKLCYSHVLGYPVDRPAATWKRYQGKRPHLGYRLWRLRQRPQILPAGRELRVLLHAPFTLHWGINGWEKVQDSASEDWQLGHVAVIPSHKLKTSESIQFTIHWRDDDQWQGENFHIDIVGDAS